MQSNNSVIKVSCFGKCKNGQRSTRMYSSRNCTRLLQLSSRRLSFTNVHESNEYIGMIIVCDRQQATQYFDVKFFIVLKQKSLRFKQRVRQYLKFLIRWIVSSLFKENTIFFKKNLSCQAWPFLTLSYTQPLMKNTSM
jgi:hypothetical protein